MGSYKIDEIEGIGPSYATKLATASIKTTDDLLDLCCNAAGRKKTSGVTGINESQLLKWSNMADLMRINGIGRQFAELLEAAGVDTVKELRTRNAQNLADKMTEVNATRKLAKTAPSASMVEQWVGAAKDTEPKITH